MAVRMGGKVAAGALLMGLAAAEMPDSAAEMPGNHFDLKVRLAPGLPLDCPPPMNISGTYRFRSMSPLGAPIYEREGMGENQPSVWSTYFLSTCGAAGAGLYFTESVPSENFTCDVPGRDYLWYFNTDPQGAANIAESNESWSGQCGPDRMEYMLQHEVKIEPMAPERDDIIISGMTCDSNLNGIYTRTDVMFAGKPVFVREDGGTHQLAFYDDLGGHCPQFKGKWVIAPSFYSSFQEWTEDDCFFEAMLGHPSELPVPGLWQESCKEERTLIKLIPRTRTGEAESACNMDFMMYLTNLCGNNNGMCSRSCSVMVDEAHRLCTEEDKMVGEGQDFSMLDIVRSFDMMCGPAVGCLQVVNRALSSTDFEHCWAELCGDYPSGPCSDAFDEIMESCQNTTAEMDVDGTMMPVVDIMSSMAWCEDMGPYGPPCSMGGGCMEPGSMCVDMMKARVLLRGEGCSEEGECFCYKDDFQGQCVTISPEMARRLNAMPCSQ